MIIDISGIELLPGNRGSDCLGNGEHFDEFGNKIECCCEGWVLGLGAKMFTIAGPVIVYGTVASVIYGVVYWVTTLF